MVHGHDGHIPTLIERRGGSERPLVLSVNSRKETSYWIQISEIVKKRLKEAKTTVENIEKLYLNQTLMSLPWLGLKLSESSLDFIYNMVNDSAAQASAAKEAKFKASAAAEAKFISDSEKLKASNFGASLLRIGSWMVQPPREGALVVKIYFAKRKLVWEILENALKKKIEIQWSDIIGIRARIMEDKPGILEIELNNRPAFFDESNPMPRKHTMWKISSDFTDNEAQTYRLHYLEFPPGTLDKHYEKLLQCDPNLLKLSQRPFPSLSSPYFHTDCYNGRKEFSLDFYRHGQLPLPFSSMHSPFKSIQQIQAYEQAHQQYLLTKNSTSPISVMDFSPHSNGAISNQGVDDPRMAMWYQRMINPANVLGRDQMQGPFSMAIPSQVNPAISGQNYNVSAAWPISDTQILDDIQTQLLSDDKFQFGYDPCLGLESLNNSVPDLQKEMNPTSNFENCLLGEAEHTGMKNVRNVTRVNSLGSLMALPTEEQPASSTLYPQSVNWLPQSQDPNVNFMMHLPGNNTSMDTVFDPDPTVDTDDPTTADFTTTNNFDGDNHWT
ncbi:hypothetical protein RGQ29_013724 [Quercus rubra]|uniref:TRF2/HOY1 PH-like domain-containing protein n=1 Tax=Quercus rubra TaxID=3512 RepID=A0AAN7FKA3_QUERU|nr:hypothetical protein RGQ29_013724 [Quercus rubra]KAK4595378.1 hypothetical protein RGQ29_013724 [Quercus rubra]KAK4595379.1 hypothetical protein RGQ29_013724 [Quercus rubra]